MKRILLSLTLSSFVLPNCGIDVLAQGAAQRPAAAAAPAASPVELGKFSTWTAYVVASPNNKQCYLVGPPQQSEPKDIQPGSGRRNATNLFIAHRPAQNVRNEFFVTIGYSFKDKANATVEVIGQAGTRRFALFTKDQGAWLLNAAEESQFVDAVRKGREMKVRGTSQRGTNTVDTYALTGIAGALDRINQECK